MSIEVSVCSSDCKFPSSRTILKNINFFAIVLFSQILFGQAGQTAVPFLGIGTSLAGNGMGEIRASSNTGSALMATFNPGLLGVQSFTTRFSSEGFTKRSLWLPGFGLSDLYVLSYAATAGTMLTDFVDIPAPIAVGIGYSSTYLNLGEFIITTENDPTPIGTFKGYERVDGISIGAAYQSAVTIGMGLNFKLIQSVLSPIGTAQEQGDGTARPFAMDIGTFMHIPILTKNTFLHESGKTFHLYPAMSLSMAYVYGNIGGDVEYLDNNQGDPLPREITAGYDLSGGIAMNFHETDVALFNVRFIREAQDIAVKRTSGNDWSFQYGFGDIQLYDNLIAGKQTARSTLKKGFELSVLGIYTTRSGSNKMDSRDFFTTRGYEVSFFGVIRLFSLIQPNIFKTETMKYFFEHVDVRYLRSSYSGSSLLSGTSFEGIAVIIK
jgi:hypothetical protein